MSKLKKLNVSEVDGYENSIFPAGTVWIDQENRLRVSDGVTEGGQPLTLNIEGTVYPSAGSGTAGIIFPSDPGGGSGDIASIKYYAVEDEEMRLHIDVQNDSDDHILVSASGNITIQPNEKAFVFGTDGVLTLPSGGDIVDSNGDSVLGGGASTGTVTFSDNVVEGSGYELGLSPGHIFTDGTYSAAPGPELGPQYLRVRGGDNYEHLHFDSNDNSKFDIYVGDDYKYFKVSKDGPAVIGTKDPSEYTFYNWTFSTDGRLDVPDGTIYWGNTIQATSESSVTLLSNNENNFVRVDDDNVFITTNEGASQWQFGGDGNLTVPNDIYTLEGNDLNIKIFSSTYESGTGAGFNVQTRRIDTDAKMSQFFVGPEDIVLTTDFNGDISGAQHEWTFDNTGNLTVPGNSQIISSSSAGFRLQSDYETPMVGGPLDGLTGGGIFVSAGQISVNYQQNDGEGDPVGPQWDFSPYGTFNLAAGGLRFNNDTTQTTAWTGGRVVAAPTHSTGAVGDTEGDLAFDDNYIYYCKADYGQVGYQVTVATAYNGATSLNTNSFQLTQTSDTEQITVGDTISDSDGGATSTVDTVSSDGSYTYVGTGGMAYNAVFPLTFTSTNPPYVSGGNIWVRVAWSGSSW